MNQVMRMNGVNIVHKKKFQSCESDKKKRFDWEESEMEAPKILIVDDESRMRKAGERLSRKKEFCRFLEAGDGEEAMDIFYEEKDIALILLDVMMPKMDGWEVCRRYVRIPRCRSSC